MRISDWSSDVCSSDLLSGMPTMQAFPDLLVGIETGDDAAVYRINDEQAIVATTDFFMPIVDDARDFGRIAAANALSDVYAMGCRPLLALAILGMPLGKLAPGTVREILAGVSSICRDRKFPLLNSSHYFSSLFPSSSFIFYLFFF